MNAAQRLLVGCGLWVLGMGTLGCGRGCGAEAPRPPDALRVAADATNAGAQVVRCAAAGCAPDPRGGREGGVLRVHVDAEPAGLCDLINHEAWVRWIAENQVMETLIEQDPTTGALSPRLAERWEFTGEAAARRIVMHLRQGVRFHDGHAFSAADVAFTLGRVRDPGLGADQRSDLLPIEKIETPDASTVVLSVPRPAPFLLQALAHISIYPRHLLEGVELRTAPFCRAPVGTGPFRVGPWESGTSLELARVEDYWGGRPQLARIVLRFVRDRQAAWLLYQRGELDVMWRLPPGAGVIAERDPRLSGHRLYRHTPRAFFFILWNTRRPALAKPEVRAALARLVDLPRFVEVAFAGRARPQSGPYVAGSPSYDERIEPWPYSPAEARTQLGALPEAPRSISFLSTVGSPAVEQLGTLLEEDLRRVGISLSIEKVDFARLLERLRRHDFDAAALQLTLAREQDNFGLFHSSAADEQNWAGFADADADRLMEQIRATDAPEARHALDRELHALLHARGPMSFLVSPEVDSIVAPGFGGIRPSSDGLDLARAFRLAEAP